LKRKNFIQGAGSLITASLLPSFPAFAATGKKKKLRFAYLTDIHLKPGNVPEAGLTRALQKVQSITPKVEFIINGGDSIMDALEADKTKTKIQWDLFNSILEKENRLRVYPIIGNHDIWGWFIKGEKPDSDSLYGKQWAIDELKLPNRYYSFEKGNWHFILLDSVQLNPAGGYIGKLDAPQREWLEQELASISPEKFICIVSHVPVLSICAGLFFDKTEQNGDLMIKRNLMHTDYLSLKKLFLKYKNIKVCLSGHIHLQDELEYLGIKYYCNGAVCGNWWGGAFQEFDPAFAIIELYDDGSSSRTMINY
jgi:Icc protein